MGLEALIAVCLAHFSHLCSVLALFYLTRAVFRGPHNRSFALTTALLHIVSPAGLFLSAPYAESACSFLSFTGYLLFCKSVAPGGNYGIMHDGFVILSGVFFGLATFCRSNGIFSGILLLEEALRLIPKLSQGLKISVIRHGAATGLGGILVALGFLVPQYVAYEEYCQNLDGSNRAVWCGRAFPSIYTYVQDHYW